MSQAPRAVGAAGLRALGATAALAVALIACSSGSAHAQRSDDERAREHFEAGRSHYEQRRYEDAERELLESYRLSRRAALLVNIAKAREQRLDFTGAAEALERYLEESPDAEDRVTIERRAQALRRQAAERATRDGHPEVPWTDGHDGSAAEGVTTDGGALCPPGWHALTRPGWPDEPYCLPPDTRGGPMVRIAAGAAAVRAVVVRQAFFIDVTPVTVGDYAACIAAGRCSLPATRGELCNFDAGTARHLVNCVTFEQAQAYCAYAGKRLPTGGEWELAARGTEDTRSYPWGDSWIGPFRSPREQPVGNHPAGASPYGVLDLNFHVWEWTDEITDAGQRVLRGGDMDGLSYQYLRRLTPYDTGFRCAHGDPAEPYAAADLASLQGGREPRRASRRAQVRTGNVHLWVDGGPTLSDSADGRLGVGGRIRIDHPVTAELAVDFGLYLGGGNGGQVISSGRIGAFLSIDDGGSVGFRVGLGLRQFDGWRGDYAGVDGAVGFDVRPLGGLTFSLDLSVGGLGQRNFIVAQARFSVGWREDIFEIRAGYDHVSIEADRFGIGGVFFASPFLGARLWL